MSCYELEKDEQAGKEFVPEAEKLAPEDRRVEDEKYTLVPPGQFRVNGQNVALFLGNRFLLLPTSEVEATEVGNVKVSKENLEAALDVTPDLPPRVIGLAWKSGVLFSPVDPVWAKDVARAVKGKRLSATDIIRAYNEV